MSESFQSFGSSTFQFYTSNRPTPHFRLKSLLSQRTDLDITDQEPTINQISQTHQEAKPSTRSAQMLRRTMGIRLDLSILVSIDHH